MMLFFLSFAIWCDAMMRLQTSGHILNCVMVQLKSNDLGREPHGSKFHESILTCRFDSLF